MTNVLDPSQLPQVRALPEERRAADLKMLRMVGSRRRGNRVVLGVAGIALTGAIAAAGVIATHTAEASNKNLVQCHTTLDVGRGDEFPGTNMALARATTPQDPGGPIMIEDAVGSCADLWRQGAIRVGTAQFFAPDGHDFPVPSLVACVNGKGVAAVFPSSDIAVCDSLGLERLAHK